MIKLDVEIDDFDTGETIFLTLPCDVRQRVDLSHDLQISDWSSSISIGFDNIEDLNETIDDMNSENPLMTIELLEKILEESSASSLSDSEFLRKICESDFMLEEFSNPHKLQKKNEQCACFLATEMLIPFAKNISEKYLEELCQNQIDNIRWDVVWKYYSNMGFKIIEYKNTSYAFHWGNAEE